MSSRSARSLNDFPNALGLTPELGVVESDCLMGYPPDRFERRGVGGEAGDDVPVDVRQLVAEEFVVDFLGPIGLGERLGDLVHVFHQLHPFRRRQVKELRCVTLEDEDGPAGEELIVMEVGRRNAEIRDDMIGSGPGLCAGLAGRIGHGRLALRHSSSVSTPFLINSWISLSMGAWGTWPG